MSMAMSNSLGFLVVSFCLGQGKHNYRTEDDYGAMKRIIRGQEVYIASKSVSVCVFFFSRILKK